MSTNTVSQDFVFVSINFIIFRAILLISNLISIRYESNAFHTVQYLVLAICWFFQRSFSSYSLVLTGLYLGLMFWLVFLLFLVFKSLFSHFISHVFMIGDRYIWQVLFLRYLIMRLERLPRISLSAWTDLYHRGTYLTIACIFVPL